MQWDLPTNYAASAFHTRNIEQFAADVEKATGGSLKIGGAIAKEWAASAGAEGEAMLATYRK